MTLKFDHSITKHEHTIEIHRNNNIILDDVVIKKSVDLPVQTTFKTVNEVIKNCGDLVNALAIC
jgi:hypothetical protein